LTFSPPDSQVELSGALGDEGYVISIVDHGIGMSEEDIERANVRLSASESFTVAPSRYLGHYVVAQLALRHQIMVTLDTADEAGMVATVLLPFTLLDDGSGPEMADIEAFSFADIAVPDESDAVRDAPEPADAIAASAPAPGEPVREPELEPLDVPEFLAGAAAGGAFAARSGVDESPVDVHEPAPEVHEHAIEVHEPPVEAPAAELPPVPPVLPEIAPVAFAEPELPTPEPEPELPAAPKVDRSGAFAALLHASAAPPPAAEKGAPPVEAEAELPEPLVEPAAPRAEPVQAFVQSRNELGVDGRPAPEPVADEALSFVAAAIQDDLLPQLPKRNGRRGRSQEESVAPAVPAQVLRIAAQQSHVAAPAAAAVDEPVDVVATTVAAPDVVSPGAPPLPRRELDAESTAPPPRAVAAAEEPDSTEGAPRPNYELFAAFRAATDQGRADAVRRGSDGGGA
jgi:hypothetical protein